MFGKRVGALVVVPLLAVGCASAPRAVTEPAPGRYPVPVPVGSIVVDAEAFARFASAVRPDLERDASSAADPAVRKSRWFVVAMLDALDGELGRANAALDRVVALEPDPLARAMIGLTLRALYDSSAQSLSFSAALDARVAELPIEDLRGELSMLRTMAQQFTPEVCRALVQDAVGSHVEDGTVAIDHAHAIVFQRYAVVNLVPNAKSIDEVLAAHGIEPVRQ